MARRRTQYDPARYGFGARRTGPAVRPPVRVQPVKRVLPGQPVQRVLPGPQPQPPPFGVRPPAPTTPFAPPANQQQLIDARLAGQQTPAAPAPATPGAGGIPNLPPDALYEAQRRQLEDQLAAQLAAIGVERDQIPAITQLLTARMATQQEESTRQVNEGANARGVYDSGIRTTNVARSDLGYDQQRQDLAMQMAERQRGIAQQEAEARAAYQSQLMEALLGLAERAEPMGVPAGGEAAAATAPNGGLSPALQQQEPQQHSHGHGGPNSRNHHGQHHGAMHTHAHRHAK
jgi:hypothetical protein